MTCKKCNQELPKAICPNCGKEFPKIRKDKIYCSRSCKNSSLVKRKK